ncbi:MAG: hypothetical protein AAF206_08935 [Bacteroidota bacterium]
MSYIKFFVPALLLSTMMLFTACQESTFMEQVNPSTIEDPASPQAAVPPICMPSYTAHCGKLGPYVKLTLTNTQYYSTFWVDVYDAASGTSAPMETWTVNNSSLVNTKVVTIGYPQGTAKGCTILDGNGTTYYFNWRTTGPASPVWYGTQYCNPAAFTTVSEKCVCQPYLPYKPTRK